MTPPYEIIIPSASRPPLCQACLISFLARVDAPPRRILVHDDAAFPGKGEQVRDIVAAVAGSKGIPYVFERHDPPLSHGPSLAWLLGRVETD